MGRLRPEGAAGPWDGGWHRGALRRPSPNHGPRPPGVEPDLLVVHSISLPPGQYGGPEIEALFSNTLDVGAHPYFARLRGVRVSAHFVVRRDGALLQFVDCGARAWHAGPSGYRGRPQCNDDSIGIELEGLEGGPFEAAQYATLAGLCADLALRYPVCHVAGHEHIAPGRKHDPGAAFDWAGFAATLGWARRCFPTVPAVPPA